jgi:hypothetical protein
MCIIAVAEERNLTKEEFFNCFDSNNDGFGMAWYRKTKKGIVSEYQKGIMNKKSAWAFYREMIKLKVSFPYVCHFRITSSGETCRELTHPFLITRKSPIRMRHSGQAPLLFHNGTVSNWKDLQTKLSLFPKGVENDTRIVAMAVAAHGSVVLDLIGGWNKFALMTNNGIEKFGDWQEEKGVSFSNSGYKSYYYGRSVTYWKNGKKYIDGTSGSYYDYYDDEYYNDATPDTLADVTDTTASAHSNILSFRENYKDEKTEEKDIIEIPEEDIEVIEVSEEEIEDASSEKELTKTSDTITAGCLDEHIEETLKDIAKTSDVKKYYEKNHIELVDLISRRDALLDVKQRFYERLDEVDEKIEDIEEEIKAIYMEIDYWNSHVKSDKKSERGEKEEKKRLKEIKEQNMIVNKYEYHETD